MSLSEMPQDVKALEERIVEKVHQAGREFYAAAFRAFQRRWVEQQRAHYIGQCWREIDQVTPFGLIRGSVLNLQQKRAIMVFRRE